LIAVLPGFVVRVRNTVELLSAISLEASVVFIDLNLLQQIDAESFDAPIVAIVDSKPADVLPDAIRALALYPWLSHVVGASLLSSPRAHTHFAAFLERFAMRRQAVIGPSGVGRCALLACASRREARFQRMREFFSKHGLADRATSSVIEVAEELVMNALYDAPAESGYFPTPRQRSEDVLLPEDLACELSYGLETGTAFVRLRDPFGALSRSRLVQVLTRCNSKAVVLDESRGGAGLGVYRVFSVASSVTITVSPGSLTEIFAEIRVKDGRAVTKQLEAVHLFFGSDSMTLHRHHGLIDQSVALA
jgi:hypothetical protein